MYKYFLALVFFLFSSLSLASEDVSLTPEGCYFVAETLATISAERDQGLSKESQIKDLDAAKGLHPQLKELFKKEIDKIYSVYKQLPPEAVAKHFFEGCYKHKGEIKKLIKSGTNA